MHALTEILRALAQPADFINPDANDDFDTIAALDASTERSLVFVSISDDAPMQRLFKIPYACAIISSDCSESVRAALTGTGRLHVLVPNPRLLVTRILKHIFPTPICRGERHPSAFIHPEARVHESVSIGAFAQIGNCEIGELSHIGAHCVIHDDVVIQKRVIIREHCSIGGAGFGFARDESGLPLHMPHIGKTILEDDVELFPYVNVDRSALGETRIMQGVKIDHYSHIGHNCTVEKYTLIAAGTILCGGVHIGENVFIGAGSRIKENVKIGNHARTGLGAVVINDVPEGATVAGVPAKQLC